MTTNEHEMRSEFLIHVPDVPRESGVAEFNDKVIATIRAIVETEYKIEAIVDDHPEATLAELETQVAKLRADLHGHYGTLSKLAVERQVILESIEDSMRKNLHAAVTEQGKTRARIEKALEKAGLGVQSMPSAGVNPPAAMIQFNHQVDKSSDVRQAREIADQAQLAVDMLDEALRECINVELRQRSRLKALTRQLLQV